MSPAPHGLTYATLITALRLTMSIRQARSIAAQYRTEDTASTACHVRQTIPLPYIDGRYLIRYCPSDKLYYASPAHNYDALATLPFAAALRRIASAIILTIAAFTALASPALAAAPHSRDVTKHRSDMGKHHAAPNSQPPTIHRQHNPSSSSANHSSAHHNSHK